MKLTSCTNYGIAHRYNNLGWSKATYRKGIKAYLASKGSRIIGKITWYKSDNPKKEWSECTFRYSL